MKEMSLWSVRKRRYKAPTDSDHAFSVAENVLNREFVVDAPNVAWVADITSVWTSGGWLYPAAIVDLSSRKVVGYAMSARIDRTLALKALEMAKGRRHDYRIALEELAAVCSMSRKGNSGTTRSPKASSPR